MNEIKQNEMKKQRVVSFKKYLKQYWNVLNKKEKNVAITLVIIFKIYVFFNLRTKYFDDRLKMQLFIPKMCNLKMFSHNMLLF